MVAIGTERATAEIVPPEDSVTTKTSSENNIALLLQDYEEINIKHKATELKQNLDLKLKFLITETKQSDLKTTKLMFIMKRIHYTK